MSRKIIVLFSYFFNSCNFLETTDLPYDKALALEYEKTLAFRHYSIFTIHFSIIAVTSRSIF